MEFDDKFFIELGIQYKSAYDDFMKVRSSLPEIIRQQMEPLIQDIPSQIIWNDFFELDDDEDFSDLSPQDKEETTNVIKGMIQYLDNIKSPFINHIRINNLMDLGLKCLKESLRISGEIGELKDDTIGVSMALTGDELFSILEVVPENIARRILESVPNQFSKLYKSYIAKDKEAFSYTFEESGINVIPAILSYLIPYVSEFYSFETYMQEHFDSNKHFINKILELTGISEEYAHYYINILVEGNYDILDNLDVTSADETMKIFVTRLHKIVSRNDNIPYLLKTEYSRLYSEWIEEQPDMLQFELNDDWLDSDVYDAMRKMAIEVNKSWILAAIERKNRQEGAINIKNENKSDSIKPVETINIKRLPFPTAIKGINLPKDKEKFLTDLFHEFGDYFSSLRLEWFLYLFGFNKDNTIPEDYPSHFVWTGVKYEFSLILRLLYKKDDQKKTYKGLIVLKDGEKQDQRTKWSEGVNEKMREGKNEKAIAYIKRLMDIVKKHGGYFAGDTLDWAKDFNPKEST